MLSFNSKRLIPVLLNPWLLAVPFSAMIILFVPPIPKYKAEFISKDFLPGTCFFYADLDSDGITEKVGVKKNSLDNASLRLYNVNGGLIDQVNFSHGLTCFPPNLIFGDSDHNDYREIFLFTASDDSVFLAFLEPMSPGKFTTQERFIDRIRKIEDTVDFTASSGPDLMKDMNRDGYDETDVQ